MVTEAVGLYLAECNERQSKPGTASCGWREYNAALVKRRSLMLWVSQEILGGWQEATRTSKPGAPRTYSDAAVTCMAMVSAVYRLALRTRQGLLSSVLR
jgi:hypothetical protein